MPTDIRAFYNDLTRTRMVNYHTSPNLRVEKACRFVLDHIVQPADSVFEIGCGVGVCTKALAAFLSPAGALYSVDISDDAVAVAQSYVSALPSPCPNVVIERADILSPEFNPAFVRPPTTVAILDTLEHLPLGQHFTVFTCLNYACAEHAQILITLPSPEYQAFLINHNAAELQPIDLSVSELMLQECATWFGGRLVSYQHVDVWRPRQYVHARIVR